MTRKALIVIDYTFDFVADEGKLTCGEPAQYIEQRIVALADEFKANGDLVVMAVDLHTENDPFHPETKLFPPHNVQYTEGRKLYGTLGPWYENNKEHVYWMDKTRYSAFAGTDLDLKLRTRQINEVHLAGVCTDICVLHTAVDAYNKAYRIVIHQDGVQSFNAAGHDWALQHFKNTLGARVVLNGIET